MQRHGTLGRAILVIGLCGLAAACSQWQELKAKKLFKDANTLYQQQDYRRAATQVRGGASPPTESDGSVFLSGQQLRQPVQAVASG